MQFGAEVAKTNSTNIYPSKISNRQKLYQEGNSTRKKDDGLKYRQLNCITLTYSGNIKSQIANSSKILLKCLLIGSVFIKETFLKIYKPPTSVLS